jgi:hypothetical protein
MSAEEERVFLEERVNIRLTKKEKACLVEETCLAGLTLSTLGRRRLLGRVVVSHEVILARHELRRMGGLLKRVHVESDGAYSKQTAEALSLITSLLKALDV